MCGLTQIICARQVPTILKSGATLVGFAGPRRGCGMDKDRIAGSAKVLKGKVKVAVGKAVGDAKLESEGRADKIEGTVQNAVGGIKDALKGK